MVIVGLVIILVLGILLWLARIPTFQRCLIYLYYVRLPASIWPIHYTREGYHKAVRITTVDNENLGAWVYTKHAETTNNRVVLYLHGNAGTRRQSRRYKSYDILGETFQAKVLTVDYRGFGDSSGTPTERGLVIDAISCWNYIVDEMHAKEIFIWGHSLGTGVSCRLAEVLSIATEPGSESRVSSELKEFVSLFSHPVQKEHFKGLILEAPFESIIEAANSHYVASPMWIFPRSFRRYLYEKVIQIRDRFDSISRISEIHFPILVVHGKNDWIIGVQQGANLAKRASSHKALELISGEHNASVFEGLNSSNNLVRLCLFNSAGHNNVSFQKNFKTLVGSYVNSCLTK